MKTWTRLSQVHSSLIPHPPSILSCVCLDGIPAATISVSSLGSDTPQPVSSATSSNESAIAAYKQQINSYANARDYLMRFTDSLLITTSYSIKLQSASLAQLTQSINQLTRTSAVIMRFFSFIPTHPHLPFLTASADDRLTTMPSAGSISLFDGQQNRL